TYEGELVRAALDRIAAGYGPDPVTGIYDPYETRMADALVELAGLRLGADPDPDRASVVVYVGDDVLSGEPGPAETDEANPLCAETARRAACDCRWRPLVRDIATRLLDLGP